MFGGVGVLLGVPMSVPLGDAFLFGLARRVFLRDQMTLKSRRPIHLYYKSPYGI